MDNQEPFIIHPFWKWTQWCNARDKTGGQRQENPDGFNSESRILEIQRAERAALTQHAERLCTATKARNDAVLERLGLSIQHVPEPPPQLLAFPRKSTKSSLRGRRISPLSVVPHFNVDINKDQRSPESLDEEDDSFWHKVLLASQMACKDRDESPTASISSASTLSSRDTHTPSELRAIPLIRSPFNPTPPPLQRITPARRRVSRLPVPFAKLTVADKQEVADGCRLIKKKVKAIMEKLVQLDPAPSSQPPTTVKTTPAVMPLVPTPPSVPKTKKRGTHSRAFLRPAKAVSEAGKQTASDCSSQSANNKKVELQRLTNPVESLCLSFKLLSSDDWMNKVEGLRTVQALAQHHPETLKAKLHKMCLVLTEEVKNLRSAVACVAMNTLAELYVHLQTAMDPEAEGTGRALLMKLAQTTNTFIHRQANLALDAMVQNCSYGRIVSTLLNTGLSHRCVAVRGSTAQHLHLLTDSFGPAYIWTAGRSFIERFLIAVSKMSVDAAPEVRHYGQMILHELALHKDFENLWKKIIPEKERWPLDKILKKAK